MILDTRSETWYLEKHCLTAAKRLESTRLCSVGAQGLLVGWGKQCNL